MSARQPPVMGRRVRAIPSGSDVPRQSDQPERDRHLCDLQPGFWKLSHGAVAELDQVHPADPRLVSERTGGLTRIEGLLAERASMRERAQFGCFLALAVVVGGAESRGPRPAPRIRLSRRRRTPFVQRRTKRSSGDASTAGHAVAVVFTAMAARLSSFVARVLFARRVETVIKRQSARLALAAGVRPEPLPRIVTNRYGPRGRAESQDQVAPSRGGDSMSLY
jgi:hypothetical protein